MSVYAIGDIQGCLGSLQQLLKHVEFNPDNDRLLLAGDLVARGPDSLGTLRFLYSIKDNVHAVLGNHDLHLLALAHGKPARNKDQDLQAILKAEDSDTLLQWLIEFPLLHEEPEFNAVMAHAGMPPLWKLSEARARANEIAAVLQSEQKQQYFDSMYGNTPINWDDSLSGPDRWRVITNYFTRMRFVNEKGDLELDAKGSSYMAPKGYFPWFEHPKRKGSQRQILFGHWAALEGKTHVKNVHALDYGCVWGGKLAALRLDDMKWFFAEAQ